MSLFDWPSKPKPFHVSQTTDSSISTLADLPNGDFRFIALDVETASYDAFSICQIGIACVAADHSIETFSTYVNPQTDFAAGNIRIHGITPDHVQQAPDFPVAFTALAPLLARHHIIQHSGFDRRAMYAACDRDRIDTPDWTWADSVQVARRAWPEFKGNGGHGLAHLKHQLDLDFAHHDAGEDARAAAMVVLLAEQRLNQPFTQIIQPARTKPAAKTPPPAPNPDGPLAGASVVFSGKFTMARTEMMQRAAAAGLAIKASLSQSTTYFVLGGQAPRRACVIDTAPDAPQSAKHRRALAIARDGYPIMILDEAAFLARL